jgi:hypothetical protein
MKQLRDKLSFTTPRDLAQRTNSFVRRLMSVGRRADSCRYRSSLLQPLLSRYRRLSLPPCVWVPRKVGAQETGRLHGRTEVGSYALRIERLVAAMTMGRRDAHPTSAFPLVIVRSFVQSLGRSNQRITWLADGWMGTKMLPGKVSEWILMSADED